MHKIASRYSNLELLRIVAMLAIVAHHYVVNSTVLQVANPIKPTEKLFFLQLWGMWGKTAINAFVLITGYFMCVSRLTLRRYLKILLEIIFYAWLMWLVLCFTGYETLVSKDSIKHLFLHDILARQDNGFVPGFMWMYLLIPFMNVYLGAASKRNLYCLLSVLLVMFSVCGTILNANVYHHVFWYCTLYFVGAAIRIHPLGWMSRNTVCLPALASCILLAWASVISIDILNASFGWVFRAPFMLVSDSHKLLAFGVGLFAFLTFKNWNLPQSRLINSVASTTFGVLLIHAASDGMRKWLWQDFINVPSAYSLPLCYLALHAVVSTLGVFSVCSALDYVRIRVVEGPLFRKLECLGLR